MARENGVAALTTGLVASHECIKSPMAAAFSDAARPHNGRTARGEPTSELARCYLDVPGRMLGSMVIGSMGYFNRYL